MFAQVIGDHKKDVSLGHGGGCVNFRWLKREGLWHFNSSKALTDLRPGRIPVARKLRAFMHSRISAKVARVPTLRKSCPPSNKPTSTMIMETFEGNQMRKQCHCRETTRNGLPETNYTNPMMTLAPIWREHYCVAHVVATQSPRSWGMDGNGSRLNSWSCIYHSTSALVRRSMVLEPSSA